MGNVIRNTTVKYGCSKTRRNEEEVIGGRLFIWEGFGWRRGGGKKVGPDAKE